MATLVEISTLRNAFKYKPMRCVKTAGPVLISFTPSLTKRVETGTGGTFACQTNRILLDNI
ncbi:hypothetical protein ACTXT7_008355 [Hymenolepis weldensis]